MVSLLWAALAYALLAIPVIVILRVQARKNYRQHVRIPDTMIAKHAAQGTTGVQLWSLTLHFILVVFAYPVFYALYVGLHNTIVHWQNGLILVLIALVPLTIATILVNAAWLYNKTILLSEQRAIVNKTASPLVYIEHVFAWVTWIAYLGLGLWILFTSLI
jgi:hypothetical protein